MSNEDKRDEKKMTELDNVGDLGRPRPGSGSRPPSGGGEQPLPPEAQGRIAAQLREVYGQMLAEPLPDKFAQLLDQLASAERAHPSKPEQQS